jgi:hypothetical protein
VLPGIRSVSVYAAVHAAIGEDRRPHTRRADAAASPQGERRRIRIRSPLPLGRGRAVCGAGEGAPILLDPRARILAIGTARLPVQTYAANHWDRRLGPRSPGRPAFARNRVRGWRSGPCPLGRDPKGGRANRGPSRDRWLKVEPGGSGRRRPGTPAGGVGTVWGPHSKWAVDRGRRHF